MEKDKSYPIPQLLKHIYATLKNRPQFLEKLDEITLPSFSTSSNNEMWDEGVVQASEALLEIAFAVHSVVNLGNK